MEMAYDLSPGGECVATQVSYIVYCTTTTTTTTTHFLRDIVGFRGLYVDHNVQYQDAIGDKKKENSAFPGANRKNSAFPGANHKRERSVTQAVTN